MKKTLYLIGFSIALLFSINASTSKVYEPITGGKAPELRITERNSEWMTLSDLKGRYVLLNFWASSDAKSRISTKEYDKFIDSVQEGQISLISINFDRSESLFNEIVKIDGLKNETQHYAGAEEAKDIIQAYELSEGFKSFLIDPHGKIIAVNPRTAVLNELLKNS